MYPFIFLRQFEFEKTFSLFPYYQPSFPSTLLFSPFIKFFAFPMWKPAKACVHSPSCQVGAVLWGAEVYWMRQSITFSLMLWDLVSLPPSPIVLAVQSWTVTRTCFWKIWGLWFVTPLFKDHQIGFRKLLLKLYNKWFLEKLELLRKSPPYPAVHLLVGLWTP